MSRVGIAVTGINADGFILPANHTWNAVLINGKKHGKVTVKDEKGLVSHILSFENDSVNGICAFFVSGKLTEK